MRTALVTFLRALVMTSAVLLANPSPVFAHSGGLNADGCHTDRRNGGYHCHRGGQARSAPARPRSSEPAGSSSRRFANCAEARAAGAAPVRRGEPGYGPHLDRDGDGIGCEA